MQVPCGLQGKMRGPSHLCPACSTGLGKNKTCSWFCRDVLACVCPATCTPGLSLTLLSVPTPLMVRAGCWDGVLGRAVPQLRCAEGTAERPCPAGTVLTRKQGREKALRQRRYKQPKVNNVSQRGGTGNTDCPPSGGSLVAEQTVAALPVSTRSQT